MSVLASGVVWYCGMWSRVSGLIEEPFTESGGDVRGVAFSRDDKTLAAGYSTLSAEFGGRDISRVVEFDVDLKSWQRIAGGIANRNLTRDEWRKFFPNEPYRPTFPELPVPPEVTRSDVAAPTARSR